MLTIDASTGKVTNQFTCEICGEVQEDKHFIPGCYMMPTDPDLKICDKCLPALKEVVLIKRKEIELRPVIELKIDIANQQWPIENEP